MQSRGKAVKNSAVLPTEDVANAAQAEEEVSANEGYGATNSETPGLASKPVTGRRPWPPAIPKIAGKWRDTDSRAVSRSLKMATPFALLDGEPLLMELDSSHPVEVPFLGNALRAPTTRNTKRARTRRESVGSISGDGMHIQLECSDSLFGTFAGAANRE